MNAPANASFNARLLVMRIIVLAQCMGLAVFTGIMLYLTLGASPPPTGQNPPANNPIDSIFVAIPFGLLALAMLVRVVIRRPPAMPERRVEEQHFIPLKFDPTGEFATTGKYSEAELSDPNNAAIQQALNAYQTRLIISCALHEGAGFFACISAMITGNPAMLAVPGLILLLLASHFPTRTHVVRWIERYTEAHTQA